MAEEESPLPPPDMGAIKAALNRKTLHTDCSVCGEDHWTVVEGVNVLMGGLDPLGGVELGLGLQVVTVVCLNCGHVRLHTPEQLLG